MVFKNQAFYHQKRNEWAKAFDWYRVSLKLEGELNEFTGTTLLNWCILLSKIDNTADSLKYAKMAKEEFEKELKIK